MWFHPGKVWCGCKCIGGVSLHSIMSQNICARASFKALFYSPILFYLSARHMLTFFQRDNVRECENNWKYAMLANPLTDFVKTLPESHWCSNDKMSAKHNNNDLTVNVNGCIANPLRHANYNHNNKGRWYKWLKRHQAVILFSFIDLQSHQLRHSLV